MQDQDDIRAASLFLNVPLHEQGMQSPQTDGTWSRSSHDEHLVPSVSAKAGDRWCMNKKSARLKRGGPTAP